MVAVSPGSREVRAAYVNRLGGADEINVGLVPGPQPTAGDVLVEVTATAVNRVDTFVRSGVYRTNVPFPFVVGRDLVGRVITCAARTGFAPGDRVWCNSIGYDGRQGAAAEQTTVPSGRLYGLPAGVSPQLAVSMLHPVATAHLAVTVHGQVRPGETVLVTGAAGNVGSAALVLARSVGARVLALCGASDLVYCRSLGADASIDYRAPDRFRRLADIAPKGIDVIVDSAGVNDVPRLLDLLSLRGRIVLLAGATDRPILPVGQLYMGDRSIRGFAISNAGEAELAQAAAVVNAVLSKGEYRPRRIEVHPLDRMPEIHKRVERDGQHGTRFVVQLGLDSVAL